MNQLIWNFLHPEELGRVRVAREDSPSSQGSIPGIHPWARRHENLPVSRLQPRQRDVCTLGTD